MDKKGILGQEWCFSQLISGNDDNPVKERLKRTRRRHALDLGCAEATDLLMLYHAIGFERLEGVDSSPEERIMDKYNKSHGKAYRDRFSAYQGGFTLDPNDAVKTLLTDAEFKEILSVQEEFIQRYTFKEPLYDVIIASNVLHYLTKRDVEVTVRRILTHLAPGGVFYIRIRRTPSAEFQWQPGVSYGLLQECCRKLLARTNAKEFIHPPYIDTGNNPRDEETVWTNL